MQVLRRLLLGICVSCVYSLSAFAEADLVSHRAFYSIALTSDSSSDAVSSVDGAMIMSLERTCDGWIFTQDMKTVIALHDGVDLKQTALFTSWESLDGTAYRFASQVSAGDANQVVRGRAEIGANGEGTAHYSKPESVEVALPDGTLFPVSHTVWLINEAASGNRYASRVVFTGSEELKPELINAFIGKGTSAADYENGEMAEDVDDIFGWPLTLAFYGLDGQSGVPTFEMWAFQLDNGVSPILRMNFGEFSTEMKIVRLEMLESPDCE